MKKARIHELVIKTLWVVAMIAITASLFHRRENSQEATYISAIVVTLMWIVFFVLFSGITSVGRKRVLGSPVSWWVVLALIIGAEIALLHLFITTLMAGDLISAGLAALFLSGFVRYMLGAIKDKRTAMRKEAAASVEESPVAAPPQQPQG